MAKNRVFLLKTGVYAEDSETHLAFLVERDAKAFQDRCIEHHQKFPEEPENDGSELNGEYDAAFKRFEKKTRAWARKHPLGFEVADRMYKDESYTLEPVDLWGVKLKEQLSAPELAALIRALPIGPTKDDVSCRSAVITGTFGPGGFVLTDIEERNVLEKADGNAT